MARLSKSHQFEIHEDTDIPATETATQRPLEFIADSEDKIKTAFEELEDARCLLEENNNILETLEEERGDAEDVDSKHRLSAVSAFPESVYQSDDDAEDWRRTPRTPLSRPNLQQIESLQKLQILSAPQLGLRTPRRPIIRHARSKNGTPKAIRSMQARGSPKRRRRISEQTEAPEEEEQHYPLVLLHVTLLPVDITWSERSMQEVLPSNVVENLKLLKSKVSETLLSRGILIRHPQEEYELLEERILEALELKDERLTKCGHFRNRVSVGSSSDGAADSDSGMGSSVESCDGELCTTCRHRVKTSRTAVGDREKKWRVKVFAANGLLRASAWAAAWNDMESVDVEILPWIDRDLRRQLDERAAQEDLEHESERHEREEEMIRRFVGEQVQLIREELTKRSESAALLKEPPTSEQREETKSIPDTVEKERPASTSKSLEPQLHSRDVPQPKRSSDIPLSVLLRNYLYLLAKDWRNIAIVLLGIVSISFALLSAAKPRQTSAVSHEASDMMEAQPLIPPALEESIPIQVVSWNEEDVGAVENSEVGETPKAARLESIEPEASTIQQETCPFALGRLFNLFLDQEVCPVGSQDDVGHRLDTDIEMRFDLE